MQRYCADEARVQQPWDGPHSMRCTLSSYRSVLAYDPGQLTKATRAAGWLQRAHFVSGVLSPGVRVRYRSGWSEPHGHSTPSYSSRS